MGDRLRRGLLDFVAPRLPDAPEPRDQLDEPRPAPPALLRDVGGREEGAPVRRHDDGQRPAAAPGHHLADAHVDPVDVRPLLAIDLDADEGLVEEGGHGLVLEGFMGHDMAPVAGGVADGEEDRLVFPFARAKASSPQGYQSTGFSACWRR